MSSNPFLPENTAQQGSKEWHEERAKGIGGSEIAIVLGISPYRTRYSLWLEKCGLKQPDDISHLPHVQRGVMAEPVARKLMEDRLQCKLTPKTWPQNGIVRLSDDGGNEETKQLIEVKAMGLVDHQAAHCGKIPDYYKVQCVWALGVTGYERCWFTSIRPEDNNDLAIIEVLPDNELFLSMKQEAEKFWKLVETRTPPEMTNKDYLVVESGIILDDLEIYKKAKTDYERAKAEYESAQEKLVGHAGENSIMGAWGKITRFTKKGSVNYKAIPELKGVDLEKYRSEPSFQTRITIKE